MLRELVDALEVLSVQQLLVLVLEDLHWSDPSTVEFLAYLLRRQGRARLFLIGTYRPTEILAADHPLKCVVQELQGRGHCEVLPLGEEARGYPARVRCDERRAHKRRQPA